MIMANINLSLALLDLHGVIILSDNCSHVRCSGVPRNFFWGGVQQIQLRTEDRGDGDLGAVAPWSGVLEAAVIWYKKFNFI